MCTAFEKQAGSYTKATTPSMVKGCRSFTGMLNFLSMFCPELQNLLEPIYDVTRKGRPFIWGREQQDSFDEIKCRLVKPLFLQMHPYSDTSKFMTGSANLPNTEWKA